MDDLRTFTIAAKAGSFTTAAITLGLTPSAVSRIVSRLEDRIGVRLFNRTTRRIDLTPEGESYLSGVLFVLNEIEELEASVGQSSTRPKGLLRINSGTAFGNHQLMPVLPEFLDRYPEISVFVDLTDRRVDIAAERADVAIRTGPVGDDRLIARQIKTIRRVICAAPSYLARFGRPERPEDLRHHRCITFSDQPMLSRWPFRGANGPEYIDASGRVQVSSGDALAGIAIAGAGIVRIADIIVSDALRDGRLVPLLVDRHIVDEVPVSAIYLPGRHRAPKVRVFIDFLLERLGGAQRGP
ncbi:MAG: LysR family transcriptional regulator [Proteobacteria bacterium]|nr:LysR family transcriptional regulator [Pseudomonadota bacterium]